MAIFKCKMCGGNLELEQGTTVVECEYCGTKQTVPNADNEKKLTLFSRANRLRAGNEFDKAAAVYEAIVADFPEEAEAYWGLVLCKYGIEYVDDPATAKKIPTCHRSSFDSVMDDGNFEMTLEYADTDARRVYREEAKQIEEIRKGIIEVSSKEEPYEIFICYKETDENGDRTIDSVLAQDIYDALTEKGYRTFFSRITLEDKLGQEYEPYIFAALNSAKVMLVFGTDYEYFNAVWVKNEWSRFLKLMSADKTKHLIPCFKNIDAYDMPKEFAKLQAQDMGKVGANQDLLRGIEKLLPKKQAEAAAREPSPTPVQEFTSPNVSSLSKRIFIFLEDGDVDAADAYCEKVLDIDPECAEAYLGKLLCTLRLKCEADLAQLEDDFENIRYFEKVMRYGDDALKGRINGYLQIVRRRIAAREEARQREEEARQIAELHRRGRLHPAQRMISAGEYHSVVLNTTGTALATGDNVDGECDVLQWTGIVAVAAGHYHTLGLRLDGTVFAAGSNSLGQCNVSRWENIEHVVAGATFSVGLKKDGTLVSAGKIPDDYRGVSHWNDLASIAAGTGHILGLRQNGTVLALGVNSNGECNVEGWNDILSIDAGDAFSIGRRADGTVVTCGNNFYGQCNVSGWRNIRAVAVGGSHVLGLKTDGTVVAAGNNISGQCNVSDWTDIVSVAAGESHSLGLRADGTVLAVGLNGNGQCNVHGQKLFDEYGDIEKEFLAKVHLGGTANLPRLERRSRRLCQHCGGTLKGVFSSKCAACGRIKDY